ncbi:MAG TPA: ATP-binding protein, partial [Gaiellaceae bacterium]|nr:ATP-binding protein [Gaiellaceae bacterium]
ERPLVTRPPFRAPHHSASMAAIVGGGPGPRPGEASLAHRGVLLLDELPEFQRPALEALRQPLEDGTIAIARAAGQAVFPARFQLVATMNLCPCAGRGDPAAECSCSAQRLASFRDKLSRALLDRFDLIVTVPRPRAEELAAPQAEASGPVRERVVEARERLRAELPRRTKQADELLDRAVERLPLSARGRARVARVARTAAALAGSESVEQEHVAEALAYRSPKELAA